MSIILRLGAVPNNDVGGFKDLSSEYCGVERGIGGGNRGLEEHYEPTSLSYPGCFGLPYQDHNYGAPPPPTPPPVPTEESPPLQKLPPQTVVPSDNVSYHTEVKDLGSIPALPCEEVPAAAAATEVYPVEDNSITRCICNFIHDDGYMICCDKCSVWQHIDCMGVNRNNIPDTYFCELCEPRPLDTERARQIQLKKKEFLDTLTDSSATDTDPEEASNRQMAQQQQQSMENNNLFQGLKKVKKKRRSKSGNNNSKVNNKVDGKQKKQKREKKDVKKEKENKELNKSQKASNTKDTVPVLKTRKSKLQASKKPGLSLIINENTQDPWDSSYSPWVDKYEEACENLYSADIQSLFTTSKINGVNTPDKIVPNGQLLVQLCHVTDVNKNRKGLEASETIGEGEIVIEYTGKVMLKHQFDKDNFFRYLNPFVLFYSKFENVELCIDATSFGNTARFIRRSCKANAEVRHVLKNGKIYFYVYSIKVIPRGSEITIPYDYNYKECTYCVECACLRNNCTVSKYFKRKLNANNKKDKSPMKTPKSPIKSPVKMKDKDKQASQSPVDSAESIPSVVNKVLSPKKEPQTSCTSSTSEQNTVSRVVTRAASLDQNLENCNSSLTTQSTESHSETDESVSAEKNQHKMTREERKMEAIMKAFEKLEKREERRKEALSRIDCRKSTETKKEEKEPQSEPTVPKKDVKKEKVKTKEKEKEKEKHTKSEETKASVVEEKAPEIDDVPVKEEKPVILPEEPEKITVDEKVEEEVKPEIPIEVPTVETVKEKPKPRVKRSKKVSNRRRSRANSGNVAVMEHSLSMEEESVSTPAQASCPSTPISAPVDVTTTSPSFKFLKTKKHLMNEWLSEKCQESFMSPEPLPDPGKMEPLEVKVEETIFVSCLPSPRNAMDHLRRNSQSSGSAVGKSNVAESSVGSAKKRWLRQAMWEKPRSDSGSISPVLASSGGASPSLPSPGASPPGDFVTPLKKRRMARESCDTPTGQCQSKVSPSVTPVSCTDIVMSSYDDNENIEAPSAIMEDEPSTKTSEEKSLGTVSKVSLLEYRQRLKEKGPTNKSTLSLSSLSSSHRSSSSSSSSSSTQSVHSHQSCLSSLPSLPLFDATSPTRDSSSVRHQFKSSSDLIRRKSVEKKREKPLSLTERLKQEFGFEDDEEEPAKEEKPPDPPPPQSTTHVPPPGVGQQGVTPHMTQMAHNIQGSIQTGCQLPVMMRGHASSMVSAQGSSIPPQHSGVVNPLHNVILPSQSSTPGQNSVPPSSLAGVNGSNHAPQTTSHFGPVTIPVSVGNGPDSSVTGPIAAGMLSQNQLGCNPHHQSPHSQQGFKSSQSTSQTGQQHMYPPPPASVGNGRQPAFHQQNQSHSYNQPQDGANFNLLPHAQSSSLCEQSHLQANGVVLLDYNHGYGSASKLPHDSVHHQQSQSGYSPESCHSHSQGSVQRKKPRKSKYKKDNCHSRNYSDYH